MVGNTEHYGVAGHFETILELFDDVQLYEDTMSLYIPIRLKTGVERDRVVEEATATNEGNCRQVSGNISGQIIVRSVPPTLS